MATVFNDEGERKRLFSMISKVTPDDHGRRCGRFLRLPGVPARGQWRRVRHHWLLHGRAHVAGGRRQGARSSRGSDVLPRRRPGSRRPGQPPPAGRPDEGRHLRGAAPRTTLRSPPKHAETLDKALTAADVEHTVEFYAAAHGFAVPDNAPYDNAAAQRHWDAMESFFGFTPGLTPRNTVQHRCATIGVDDQSNAEQPDPGDVGSRIDPVLAWQLAAGQRCAVRPFRAGDTSRADIVVLDIEDAVAPKDKAGRPRQRDPVAGRRQRRLGPRQRVRHAVVGRRPRRPRARRSAG